MGIQYRWRVAAPFTLAVTTVGLLASANAIAQDDDLFCYMRTESGRLVNLGDVCGVEAAPEPTITPSSSSAAAPSALNDSADISVFMTGCTESVLADGGTPEEADQYCGCFVRGLQGSGLTNEQLISFGQALESGDTVSDPATEAVVGEVVFACLFTGGLSF